METFKENYTLSVHFACTCQVSTGDITLAAKRRRILHVVADDWDNGGSESWSSAVVAEYSEELSRVVIPRRRFMGSYARTLFQVIYINR